MNWSASAARTAWVWLRSLKQRMPLARRTRGALSYGIKVGLIAGALTAYTATPALAPGGVAALLDYLFRVIVVFTVTGALTFTVVWMVMFVAHLLVPAGTDASPLPGHFSSRGPYRSAAMALIATAFLGMLVLLSYPVLGPWPVLPAALVVVLIARAARRPDEVVVDFHGITVENGWGRLVIPWSAIESIDRALLDVLSPDGPLPVIEDERLQFLWRDDGTSRRVLRVRLRRGAEYERSGLYAPGIGDQYLLRLDRIADQIGVIAAIERRSDAMAWKRPVG